MNDSIFLDLLCCPACRGDLTIQQHGTELRCPGCQYVFPIVDGIPVLFPRNVKAEMSQLFGRYWDAPEKAAMYDRNVEGGTSPFGIYNHESEIAGLTRLYSPKNLDIVLDAGCGNGRFFSTFGSHSLKIGIDASLNLLRFASKKKRGDFLVCGELEHLPFKDGVFGTAISCRVLQHLHEQERAVSELSRVTRDKGDVILELYNRWNIKSLYKQIRMSRRLRKVLNAPFRLIFRSLSPFQAWGLEYDRYSDWFEVKRWMRAADLHGITGRGVGFGYHKYLFQPFYVDAVLRKRAPRALQRYYRGCIAVERRIGGPVPFRYLLEKFAIKATRNAPERDRWLGGRVLDRLSRAYKGSALWSAAAIRETERELQGRDRIIDNNGFHLAEAVAWLKRAQDATPDGGVSRGFSVGWNPYLKCKGWQPSYPETTGYIIPTFFDCAEFLGDSDLRRRAVAMANWECVVQLDTGAVMAGTVGSGVPSPAVFNTGQVVLGWLRASDETNDQKYLDASERAARFLAEVQSPDGAWRRGDSAFALSSGTTYNSRVGWALVLHGQRTGEHRFVEAGRRSIDYAISQQAENGWFANACLSDPTAPLLHTICYTVEGLLGAYDALGETEYLRRASLTVGALRERIGGEGSIPGRFDANWNGTVAWSCLTGNAQLAGLLLRLFAITAEDHYQVSARRLLDFIKGTQNCVSDEGGMRGGVKGSYPFDGGYGRYEILNWATKFYVDALWLDDELSRPDASRRAGGAGEPEASAAGSDDG